MLHLEHKNSKKDKLMNFIHIRVPIEIRNSFKAIAASKGMSMTQLAYKLIADFLEKNKETA